MNIMDFYTFLQSQETAQKFLVNSYHHIGVHDPEVKGYENCHTFLYCLKHGLHFYDSGKNASTTIQPVLYFYGMIHLLKAFLLTKRPNYPESTRLLAHGVSSRKRKKKDYTFINDEVTIQSNGLYSYFSEHLYQINSPLLNKVKMKDLLALIPEMTNLFTYDGQAALIQVGNIDDHTLIFNNHLLDDYHLTAHAFIKRISPYLPPAIHTVIKPDHIQITIDNHMTRSFGPFFIHMEDQGIYFPADRELFLPISEIMIHYLLLYNLSMISRYETEWWGDLLTMCPDIDFPFIKAFLTHTANKVPLLLGYEIYQYFELLAT